MVQPSYPAEDTLGVTSQNTTLMSSYIKEPPNRVKARIKHLRRDVASKIRDGWVFHWQGKRPGPAAPNPPPPHSNLNNERASVSCNGADLSLMGDSSFDNGGHGSSVKDTVDPRLHYRRRSYSSSLNSTESSSEEPSSRRRRRRRRFRSTFKFEDPDSVLRTLADQARHDRRTRRHNLEEEMSWNRGLNHWMVQRDAWVGAVRGAKRRGGHSKHTRPAPPADLMAIEHEADTSEQDYDPMDIDWDPSYQTDVTPSEKPTPPVTSLLSEDDDDDDDDDDEEENESYNNRRNNPHNDNDAVYDETGHDSQGRDHYTRTVQGVSPLSSCESLIPIAPPLIPLAEATEIGISERAYPQIYSKVVLCGQTPAIPINLAHMTKALVQGWKADGTWPPQQAGPGPTTSTTSIRPKEGDSHHAGEYTNGHHGLTRRPTGAEQSVTHARVKHRKHSLRGSISGLGPLGGSVRRALGFGESAAAAAE